MKISVLGTGYVGLVSGVGLASVGHVVSCFDNRAQIVDSLSQGTPTIYEPGLPELLERVRASGNISFAAPTARALSESEVILIAVGTPSKDGDIDLSYVREVARMAGEAISLADHTISVIVKSTVVPGTTRGLVTETVLAASGGPRDKFGIGMNPEFLREGCAISDFQFPDRIVLGHEDSIALAHLEQMYSPFDVDKIKVNTATAELTKYANNMLLALQISAANEIANVAAVVGGIDPMDVIRGVVADARWGGPQAQPIVKYLIPGPGFGGSCFPKDVEAIRELGQAYALPMHVSSAVLAVNAEQPSRAISSMLDEAELRGKKVVVLGLAFKPDTDDVRATPALGVVLALQGHGAIVTAHDPLGIDGFRELHSEGVAFVTDWKAAVLAADVVVVPTPWGEYSAVPGLLKAGQILVDPRRAYSPSALAPDVSYRSLGIR